MPSEHQTHSPHATASQSKRHPTLHCVPACTRTHTSPLRLSPLLITTALEGLHWHTHTHMYTLLDKTETTTS